METARTPYSFWIVKLTLLAYPALLLTVRGGMNGMFLLLLVISLFLLFYRPQEKPVWDTPAIAFAVAMASPVIAIFLSQAYHGEFRAPAYDWAARFLFAIPIFLALRQTRTDTLSVLRYGIPIGALAGLAALLLHPYNWVDGRTTTGQFLNLIHFSDLAISLGLLSLLGIRRSSPLPLMLLGASGFLASAYMVAQTGERGAWLAIPLVILIWIYTMSDRHQLRNLAISGIAMAMFAAAAYLSVDIVNQRINLVHQDLVDYAAGHKDTSIGIRLQLWQAALQLFLQHPIFGAGPDGYAQMMPALAAQGVLTPTAATLGQGEVHNELLAKCAGLGIFGLFSYVAILLVPFLICWRALKQEQRSEMKAAALMGVGVASAFFVFGLTVEIFNLKMTAAFYALTVAVLCAAAVNRSTEVN